MDARNPDGGGSNGEALATIKSDGLMVAWGIANDRRNNRGVQVELAGGIQHINRGDVFARVTSSIVGVRRTGRALTKASTRRAFAKANNA